MIHDIADVKWPGCCGGMKLRNEALEVLQDVENVIPCLGRPWKISETQLLSTFHFIIGIV